MFTTKSVNQLSKLFLEVSILTFHGVPILRIHFFLFDSPVREVGPPVLEVAAIRRVTHGVAWDVLLLVLAQARLRLVPLLGGPTKGKTIL